MSKRAESPDRVRRVMRRAHTEMWAVHTTNPVVRTVMTTPRLRLLQHHQPQQPYRPAEVEAVAALSLSPRAQPRADDILRELQRHRCRLHDKSCDLRGRALQEIRVARRPDRVK